MGLNFGVRIEWTEWPSQDDAAASFCYTYFLYANPIGFFKAKKTRNQGCALSETEMCHLLISRGPDSLYIEIRPALLIRPYLKPLPSPFDAHIGTMEDHVVIVVNKSGSSGQR